MTNKEIAALLAMATANYPQMTEKNMDPTANLWKEMLSDISFEVAKTAIIKVLSTAKFWPTIAEIREAAAQITNPHILSPAEAWALVEEANDRYGYYRSTEGMNSLPLLVQTVIKSLGGFRDVCASEQPAVIRGQFMRMYEQYASREREMAVLPVGIRELVEGAVRMLPQ